MSKPHIPQRDLEDAMAEGGCPVCRLAERTVCRYLTSLLRERVTDVDERGRLRAARGLCNLHAWQLQEGGGALGQALIYRDLVHTLATALVEGAGAGDGAGQGLIARLRGSARGRALRLADRLRADARCPACAEREETEQLAIGGLLEYLERADFISHYRAADGLCLEHFLAALDGVREEATLGELVAVQLRAHSALRAELDEFIRKHDHRFSDEPIGAEADAWIRAIARVAGERRATSLR